MGEVDILKWGSGKGRGLVDASVRWEVCLPVVWDDEGVLGQRRGGALGGLVGDVEALANWEGTNGSVEAEGRLRLI